MLHYYEDIIKIDHIEHEKRKRGAVRDQAGCNTLFGHLVFNAPAVCVTIMLSAKRGINQYRFER